MMPLAGNQIRSLKDMISVNHTPVHRNRKIRDCVETALENTTVWGVVATYLSANGGLAGSAQFAHAMISDAVYKNQQPQLEALDVNYHELWRQTHEVLKKYGVKFDNGFMVGYDPAKVQPRITTG
jgi:hypothetical protein